MYLNSQSPTGAGDHGWCFAALNDFWIILLYNVLTESVPGEGCTRGAPCPWLIFFMSSVGTSVFLLPITFGLICFTMFWLRLFLMKAVQEAHHLHWIRYLRCYWTLHGCTVIVNQHQSPLILLNAVQHCTRRVTCWQVIIKWRKPN